MARAGAFVLVALGGAGLAAGCGGEAARGPTDAGSFGGPADLSGGRLPDATPSDCTDAPGDGGVCLRLVEATIIDEQGAPLGGVLTSVCSTGDCYFGMSGSDGRVSVAVGARVPIDAFTLVLHGRPDRAGYFVRLPPIAGGVARFPKPLRLVNLPASGPEVAVDGTAQTLVSNEVTLEVPKGTTLSPSVEDFIDAQHHPQFRSRRVPPALAPAFLDGQAPSANALYAVSPYEADLQGDVSGVRLSFANFSSAPPGTAFDLLGLGSLAHPTGPDPGVFAAVGTAHVRLDGTRIDVDPQTRLDFLTWFALLPKGH